MTYEYFEDYDHAQRKAARDNDRCGECGDDLATCSCGAETDDGDLNGCDECGESYDDCECEENDDE